MADHTVTETNIPLSKDGFAGEKPAPFSPRQAAALSGETKEKIDAFILAALHDPERRDVLLAFLQAEGFPGAYPESQD